MTRAFFVYPGLGKTTLARADDRFADIETRMFKDMNLSHLAPGDDYPAGFRGSPLGPLNPEFPENVRKYAREKLDAGKVLLFVPKQDSYDNAHAIGVDEFVFIMPSAARLEQLVADYKSRGENAEYINRNQSTRYESALNDAAGHEIIFLEPGEYLGDVINRLLK